MRLLVFSDSHGKSSAMEQVAWDHPEADALLHLGDCERDFEGVQILFPQKIIRMVRGNCDWFSQTPVVDMLTVAGKRILLAHGHTFQVKISLEDIMAEAKNRQADIVLFGHTHVPLVDYKDGIYVLNPGSISLPRAGAPTYGVVDITEAGIVTRVVIL